MNRYGQTGRSARKRPRLDDGTPLRDQSPRTMPVGSTASSAPGTGSVTYPHAAIHRGNLAPPFAQNVAARQDIAFSVEASRVLDRYLSDDVAPERPGSPGSNGGEYQELSAPYDSYTSSYTTSGRAHESKDVSIPRTLWQGWTTEYVTAGKTANNVPQPNFFVSDPSSYKQVQPFGSSPAIANSIHSQHRYLSQLLATPCYRSNPSASTLPRSVRVPLVENSREIPPVTCPYPDCNKVYTGKWGQRNVLRHVQDKHPQSTDLPMAESGETIWPCSVCDKTYHRKDARLKHARESHPELGIPPAKTRK
ncbi:hypothetical protein M011DRAFT_186094 [Sporormia fimetaria CBS 119925]|uniref:C2H2-type domain-containing protein n=1 Tax=Sporormia fimetaria CBS 119925 TaxID=1340428 RepID=A0A6A6VMS0_9PLEO|nr:hypothetical protein M011DRAFT_186094 [Sporormia fimetaria CBS 119925]